MNNQGLPKAGDHNGSCFDIAYYFYVLSFMICKVLSKPPEESVVSEERRYDILRIITV
jgi:hypothetical protein